MEQCDALGGRKILQLKQYFSLIVWLLTTISFVRGGGRYAAPLALAPLPEAWISICLSVSQASSRVARGIIPGS
jgi:hypothetical protein